MRQSIEHRPRRRASQTYFFKYQLARNPLKAEEEDIKQALLASLQQCNSNGTKSKSGKSGNSSNNQNNNNKNNSKERLASKKKRSAPSTPSKQIEIKDSKPIHPPSPDSSQYHMNFLPYTPLQRKEPPDEDYLKKYKPETEDFLTFICFRTTAPKYLKQITNETATINGAELTSPNNHRRPTRQSPRLASSNRKISATAYDNSISYEEDMKRASIALEDMAQEINSSDDINNEVAQDYISKKSSSPYKNNKHLVKGLMTREFAGAFADEETIFESISNHKL